jgi:type IV secretory pathway TrbD component
MDPTNTDDARIQSIVAAEVQRQLDRERAIIREAGSLALKIVGVAFAVLVAIFTIFGITTWRDVAKETVQYMQAKVDGLVQKSDSDTSVKQTLNDLVNRAIVAAELTSLKRSDRSKELLLPQNEWDRLKSWVKTENLGLQEFSDSLAVLAAQPESRLKSDANSFLSDMLYPPDASPYQWIKKQPDKRSAIMSNFKHLDMGTSAVELALSPGLSSAMRIAAARYLYDINYVDSFDKLLALASSTEDGALKKELLITCAKLRPTNPKFLAAMKNLTSQDTPDAAVASVSVMRQLAKDNLFDNSDKGIVVAEVVKQLLSFAFKNRAYFELRTDREYRTDRVRDSQTPLFVQIQRIVLWVPTDRTRGSATGSAFEPNEVQQLKPYWALVNDAANSGNKELVRTMMIRPGVDTRLSLGPKSELTVEGSSGEKTVLRQNDVNDVLLGQDKDKIIVRWTDRKNKTSEGMVVGFGGAGFEFSLMQTTLAEK